MLCFAEFFEKKKAKRDIGILSKRQDKGQKHQRGRREKQKEERKPKNGERISRKQDFGGK